MSWESKHIDQCTPQDVLDFVKLRTDVYFLEQKITEEEVDEWDYDPRTVHLWCREDGQLVGYARIVQKDNPDEADRFIPTSLGRFVVSASHRGRGIAGGLMERALSLVGDQPLIVHAQCYVQGFYEGFGFEPFGGVFDEAGIDHIRMHRPAGELH